MEYDNLYAVYVLKVQEVHALYPVRLEYVFIGQGSGCINPIELQ